MRRLTLGVNPGVLLGFIFLLVLLFVTTPTFRQLTTMQNLLQQASINAIIATGMTFVIITAGIDLSVGSMQGLVGTLTALTLMSPGVVDRLGDGAMPLACLIGIVAGAGIGFLNGAAVVLLRIAPLDLTVADFWFLRGLTVGITADCALGRGC